MKKGQVTIFIILGLVMVIGAVLTIAVYKNWIDFRPPDQQTTSEVPTELKPLAFAIEQCQQRITKEYVKELLFHGGYESPLEQGIVPSLVPAGKGFYLYEGSDIIIPYWYHVSGESSASEIPALLDTAPISIARQVADHLDDYLDRCVPWDAFTQYDIDKSLPKTEVSFRYGSVSVVTDWSMAVTTQLGTTTIEKFQSEVNAPVLELYEAGRELVSVASYNQMPEKTTMNWLALYATGQEDLGLPPLYAGTGSANDFRVYPLERAAWDFGRVMHLFADTISVFGSKDAPVTLSSNEAIDTLYLSGILSFAQPPTDISIRATYPEEAGVHLKVNDNLGVAIPNIMSQPSFMGVFGPPLVDNTFVYDISYPLLFRLEKDGYVLQFGYEVNIRDNIPIDVEPLEFEEPEEDDYCFTEGGTPIDTTAVFFNDPSQTVSGNLMYTCGDRTCYVGELVDGKTQVTLPTCADGYLEVEHESWFSERVQFTSSAPNVPDVVEPVEILLHEPHNVQVIVEGRYLLPPSSYDEDAQVILSANPTRINAEVLFIRHGKPFFVHMTPESGSTVELVPGIYDVYVMRMSTNPIVIPEETRQYKSGLFSKEEIKLEEITIDTVPITYLELSESETGVDRRLHLDSVYEGRTITIMPPVLDPSDIDSHERIEMIGALFEIADDPTKTWEDWVVLNRQ